MKIDEQSLRRRFANEPHGKNSMFSLPAGCPDRPGTKKEEKEKEEKEEATAAAFDGGESKHARKTKLYIQTPDRPPQRLLLVVIIMMSTPFPKHFLNITACYIYD